MVTPPVQLTKRMTYEEVLEYIEIKTFRTKCPYCNARYSFPFPVESVMNCLICKNTFNPWKAV